MLVFIITLTFILMPHSLDYSKALSLKTESSLFFLVLCTTLCNYRNFPQIKSESPLDCKQDPFEWW